MVDLCYDIFSSRDYAILTREITTSDRFSHFRKTWPPSNTALADDALEIDILCEPTTLRYNRDIESADGIFSPIVFVSGVSFLTRPTSEKFPNTYLAFVQKTTARSAALLACKNDFFSLGEDGPKVEGCNAIIHQECPFPFDVQPSKDKVSGSKASYVICSFDTHDELMKWFCHEPTRRPGAKLVYFGDREIIAAKLKSWTAKEACPTDTIEPQSNFYTYEPYALLMSKADPDLVQFVQRRVYEFFSHRSKANSLFETYFPDARMSPVVANLFLLNAVDEERFFQVPDLDAPRQ